jgi:hypothetical protein
MPGDPKECCETRPVAESWQQGPLAILEKRSRISRTLRSGSPPSWNAHLGCQRLEADSAQLPMRDLLHLLHCLGRFITTRMAQQFGGYELMPTYPDDHKRTNLRRAAGHPKKQLRCAVSPMEAQ